ncbi:MAG: AAA family ATPase [Verrucomicrobia bacterium]|nr:AAA family ATPase [Verrucomicrobiota bacterium]
MAEHLTYEYESVRTGDEFALRRGRGKQKLGTVLVVTPVSEHPSLASLARLEHEYSLRDELESDWAVRPLALTHHEGRAALVLEDPGGETLDGLIGQPMDLDRFLLLAINLAAALGKLHRRGLIHKDIKPANVLIDSVSNKVWFTGFGIASRLLRERQGTGPPETIAGTLAYMAPEQTGRMNRSIDSRSDLYSLGVTLYQMLTGLLPFQASDPMEWVHCHIARQPPKPHERREQIPEQISAIVLKLLAKNAEERYQTGAGLEADLRKCWMEWESSRRIEPFPLGQRDLPDRLLIPEKLYGRQREYQTLLGCFDRVAASGRPELVLVSGYSGVGKSSLVHELHKVIVWPRGIFITGKFDQNKRDVPYTSLAQAFRTFLLQILSKGVDELTHWRHAILESLGANGQLIVNLIPELELVIGKQSPVPELPPPETQTRFEAVLRRFVGVFACKEHPLALFLDDLQWLDLATLKLLEQFFIHPDVRHLLLIGAYRDNEVTRSHPLIVTLEAIRKSGAIVHEILLRPLSLEEVNQLLGDALKCEASHAMPLAEAVQERTGGNPFFTIQFLAALAEDHLLDFEPREAAWHWDLNRIRALGFTDSVLDLMIAKLRRLPAAAQEILKQFACLGNRVDITALSIVCGRSEKEVHLDLWEAVRAGLIQRLDTSYKFLHDRIQEAAYLLIPKKLRAQSHLRIGRLLIAKVTQEQIAETIFDIVNQLNLGLALISAPDEKERVAELNLNAGRRAKVSTAYASACIYLSAGMELLGSNAWKRRYKLAFDLWLERAECEYLNGNFQKTGELITELLSRAKSKLDKAIAYRLKVLLQMMRAEYRLAVDTGLECLRLFGIQIPAHPTREEVQVEFEKIWLNLGGRSIESLVDLPLMTDTEMQAAMRVLSVLFSPAFFTDSNLFYALVYQMANVSLKYGTTDAAASGYADLGLILGPVFHRYDEGYSFAKLAYSLVEKYGFHGYRAKVYYNLEQVGLWTQPVSAAIDRIRLAFRTCIETHDLAHACYCCNHLVTDLLLQGVHLDEVWREAQRGLEFVRKVGFRDVADVIVSQQRFILNLRGQTATFSTFSDNEFDDESFETELTDHRMPNMACWYWILKLQARFMSGDYEAAIGAARNAQALLRWSEAFIESVNYHYYLALTTAAIHERVESERQSEGLEECKQSLQKLCEWAGSCRETFLDKYTLVLAEVARIEGRDLDAMRLYEEAIRLAQAHGFVQDEGIGNELAARFYRDRGYQTIAHAYLRNARYCYLRWGALGKVRQLEHRYPAIAEQNPPSPASTIGAPSGQLDLETVTKASHAVSSELQLDKLIQTLMLIAVEHAGAERGLLILSHGEEQQIKAEARTGRNGVEVELREALITPAVLPESLLRYVSRTRESVILDDASSQNLFGEDEYIMQRCPRSVLCLPLIKQTRLIGVLYLENNLAPRVFTPKRLAMLELLASQAAISLDHAQLYAGLRRSEAFLAQGQKISRTGSWGWHVSSGEVYWSKEHFRIFDYDPETTKPSFVLFMGRVHPEDRAQFEQVLERAVREKSDFEHNYRILLPDGSIKYLRSAGQLFVSQSRDLEFIGTVMDITELTRAEEMQTAIAREREMFAHERATQLARANQALRECVDALAYVPELDDFLGQVMVAITNQLGGVSSTLRLCNVDTNILSLELVFQDGRVMSPDDAKYPEPLRSFSLADLGFLSLHEPFFVHLPEVGASAMPHELRAYLLGQRITTVLGIPLISRGQANGVLSFRFKEERHFSQEELEIARALATQASLAIQLTQLANAARHSAVLQERNRLAGEIHDSLAQNFAGISMQLTAAAGAIEMRSEDAVGQVERAIELAHFGLSEARRSALSLRSNIIEEAGLIEALHRLAERSNIPGLLRCSFRSSRVREETLAPQVQQDLLRIAQEAISNAIRHAQPTVISVTLRWTPPNLVLRITDNGSGFDKGRKMRGREGFGFTNMQERAKNLGADLSIRTRAGGGTSVIVRVALSYD